MARISRTKLNEDLLKDYPLVRDDMKYNRAEWIRGETGIPVLAKLPEKIKEHEEMDAAVEEDDPLGSWRLRVDEIQDTSMFPAESEWWESPYKGGPMVAVHGFPRAMYPPDAKEKGKTPSGDGPDVRAYKRTVARLGRWPWDPINYDTVYSNNFAHGSGGNVGKTGVAGVQRQQGIDPDTGWIGDSTFRLLRSARVPMNFPNGGRMAMDAPAVNLINQAYAMFKAPPPKDTLKEVEKAITDYCIRSIRAAPSWHYSQARPMTALGRNPDLGQYSDCSGHATQAYFWAMQQTTVNVPDCNNMGYSGWGYTGTQANNPKISTLGPFKIGDLALYGRSIFRTTHVCTCHHPGGRATSEWTSNGSEAGPYAVSLMYRYDLVAVVRPGLMP